MTSERDRLLGELEDASTTVATALARVGATQGDLARWKKDPDFLIRYAALARDRAAPALLPRVRPASVSTCRSVLAAFAKDPALGFTAHCRAAGTTPQRVEAACAGDQRLADELDMAKAALVAPVEQAQIEALLTDRKATTPRERFLSRQGPAALWRQESATPAVVNNTYNLALLSNAPQAERLAAGSWKPRDMTVAELIADDALPSLEAAEVPRD